MAGTVEGGRQAAETNKANHGADFYKRIGALGGKNGHTGGFASNLVGPDGLTGRERAAKVGVLGGRKSRKRKPMEPDNEAIDEALWEKYVDWCEDQGLRPKYKHYTQWLEESYE